MNDVKEKLAKLKVPKINFLTDKLHEEEKEL